MSTRDRYRQKPSSHRGPRRRSSPASARSDAAEPARGSARDPNRGQPRAARLQQLALALWERTRIDWGFAASRLSATVRRERWLTSDERRAVMELLYGMVRQSRRLDFALEVGGARLPPGTIRELARYFAYGVLAGELDVGDARAQLPEVDWAEVVMLDEHIARERDATQRFGLTYSLPDWLAARLLAQYGAEAAPLAAALNARAPLVARANRLKAKREDIIGRLAAAGIEAGPTELARDGVRFAGHPDVFGLDDYRQGLFEVQDEGSQLIAELVAPGAHDIVVDACAGAGGKTLALAAAMGSKGRLLAVDIDARKLDELRKRARRAGVSSVQALHTEADAWPAEVAALSGRVHRVLVDAPCTGTGALRRNPEIRWRLEDADVGRFAAVQEHVTRRAADLLAPEGRLVYATCSLLHAENETVMERVLAGTHGLEIVPPAEVLGPERAARVSDPSGRFMQTLPHRHGTDGFFAAVLRRNGGR